MDSADGAGYLTPSTKKLYKSRRVLYPTPDGYGSSSKPYKSRRITQDTPTSSEGPYVTYTCISHTSGPVCSTIGLAYDERHNQNGQHNTEALLTNVHLPVVDRCTQSNKTTTDQKVATLFQRRYNAEMETYYRNLVLPNFYICAYFTESHNLQYSTCS